MCLIISAPKGNQIPLELLEDATDRNNDGWGVMWHDGKKIISEKSHRPDAAAIYELTRNNPHQTVVHLRMTTHGDNTHANTHPFEVIPNRLLMMHNGVVDVDVPFGSKKSDTRVMVEDYIKPLVGNRPEEIRKNRGLRNFIQSLIGNSSNRLVFLDDRGDLTYFNKDLGLDWKGLWCSNTYAWTLHDERPKYAKQTAWGRHYDYIWDRQDYTPSKPAKPKVEPLYADVKWGEVDPEDDVETEFGFIVPAWVADVLEMEYDRMLDEPCETLAAVIENLRDTYIGGAA